MKSVLLCLLWCWPQLVLSDSLVMLSLGGGPQPSGHQSHRTAGIDVDVWQYQRSARQQLSIGMGYTYLHSSRGPEDELHIVSVYPQLTLTPASGDFLLRGLRPWLPAASVPYFFVRALGPSYMSRDSIGRREQRHVTLQAMFGLGVHWPSASGRQHHLTLSWKHFSNANLFADNDGIDIPLVLSFGMRL